MSCLFKHLFKFKCPSDKKGHQKRTLKRKKRQRGGPGHPEGSGGRGRGKWQPGRQTGAVMRCESHRQSHATSFCFCRRDTGTTHTHTDTLGKHAHTHTNLGRVCLCGGMGLEGGNRAQTLKTAVECQPALLFASVCSTLLCSAPCCCSLFCCCCWGCCCCFWAYYCGDGVACRLFQHTHTDTQTHIEPAHARESQPRCLCEVEPVAVSPAPPHPPHLCLLFFLLLLLVLVLLLLPTAYCMRLLSQQQSRRGSELASERKSINHEERPDEVAMGGGMWGEGLVKITR